jgi:hypothetical protein
MPDLMEQFQPEARESRASESTSAFDEVYGLLQQQQQQFKGDSLQTSAQNDVNQMFGTLDLFESETARPEPTFSRGGTAGGRSAGEIIEETFKQIPDQLGRTLGAIGDAWSHPGATLDQIAEDARRKLDDINNRR